MIYILENKILPMSQGILDHNAKWNEIEKKTTHLLIAYQNVLQDLNPGYTITFEGENLVLGDFPPECKISVENRKVVLHDLPIFWPLEELKGSGKYHTGVHKASCWKPEKLAVSSSWAESKIRGLSTVYPKLRS